MNLSLPLEVYHELHGFVGVVGGAVVLAVLSQVVDLAPIGRLVAISDQADHCRVIGKLVIGKRVIVKLATQSWVYRE